MEETEREAALVTGGSRGIGRGIALELARAGYDVAITYASRREEAETVAQTIETQYGRKCVLLAADLAQAGAAAQVVAESIQGLGRLDVLVNNAGVTLFGDITRIGLEQIDYLYHLNFRAYLLTIQAAAKYMLAQGIRGRVINITSTRAERAYPGDSVYGGLKAGLARATQSLALDLAPYGIRVNCVAPGATVTRDSPGALRQYEALGRKIPLGRAGTPEDIGQAVVWLASPAASYITGRTLTVDGGLILPGMPEDVSEEEVGRWGK